MTDINDIEPCAINLGTVLSFVAWEYIPQGAAVCLALNDKCGVARNSTGYQTVPLGIALEAAEPGETVSVAMDGTVCNAWFIGSCDAGDPLVPHNTTGGALCASTLTAGRVGIFGIALESASTTSGRHLAVLVRPQIYHVPWA